MAWSRCANTRQTRPIYLNATYTVDISEKEILREGFSQICTVSLLIIITTLKFFALNAAKPAFCDCDATLDGGHSQYQANSRTIFAPDKETFVMKSKLKLKTAAAMTLAGATFAWAGAAAAATALTLVGPIDGNTVGPQSASNPCVIAGTTCSQPANFG